MIVTHTFERTLHKSTDWLHDMMTELRTRDPELALVALRAGLHALRDRLTIGESANLAAQLPMLLRGLYYEGWQPAHVPELTRATGDFIEGVHRRTAPHQLDPYRVIAATAAVLRRHVTPGELAHVVHQLPRAVRELWEERHAPADWEY